MKKLTLLFFASAVSAMMSMAQPIITSQPSNQIVTNGGTAVFSVSVSGAGPFGYQWQFNGTNLPKSIASGTVSTVAGTGSRGYFGDGGAATNAKLNWPGGLTLDAAGNLLIADQYNNRIRRMDTNGTISTVAGSGTNGYSGDGGAATNASFNVPSSVAVDASGNLFIADQYNNCVREVDTNGIITTIAGNGSAGYSGDGDLATNASLNDAWGLAFDASGNLYIGDQYNNRVRRVDTNGIITTVAGNGDSSSYGDGGPAVDAAVVGPVGLAFDTSGNLFIAQYVAGLVRRVDTNGVITTFAGGGAGGGTDGLGDGGAATNGLLYHPYTLAFDSPGNLFISEFGHNRVRQVDTNGIITSVVGTGTGGYSGDGGAASSASLNGPLGLAMDGSGNLFISDYFNQRVRKVVQQGPTIVVNNVSLNTVGNYQVIVTNSSGSVTSRIATLTLQPQQATGVAFVTNGFVVGVNVAFSGFGYTNTPQVHIVGGGSGAQVVAVVSNGMVVAFIVLNPGIGYSNNSQVIVDPPIIPIPILSISPASFLTFSNLTLGTNYQLQQSVAWYWTNQGASFTASNLAFTQIVSGPVGTGSYRVVRSPAPTQAFARVTLFNGFVIGATVTSGGSGYVTSPSVQIFGGGGMNAGATSQISGGAVTAINITNAGIGYTSTPTIEIAQPPAPIAIAPTISPMVRVDSASLAAYDNYQIQFTPIIAGAWSNLNGGLFSPTGATNSQFLFPTNNRAFFRLRYMPGN